MQCGTCGTDAPGASPWDLCQHCGHALAGNGTIFDRLLAAFHDFGHHAEKVARANANRYQKIPQDQSFPVSLQVPAGGGNVITSFGHPQQGRIWQVRRLTIAPLAVGGGTAGTLYIVRQGAPPNDLSLANLVDVATSMPLVAFYGTHQFVVRPGERVWGIFTGGTNGQQYVGSMQVEDWEEAAFAESDYVE